MSGPKDRRPRGLVSVAKQPMPYEYVVLRCVPRVDREEFLNVGVVLHCHAAQFLGFATQVDSERLRALDPDLDVDRVRESLAFAEAVCSGHPSAGAPAAERLSHRFGFLKAPRSTVIQPGPVHGGVTLDPPAALERLRHQLIADP